MLLAIDVDYREREACAAGVCFSKWDDDHAQKLVSSQVIGIEDYTPGQFYKRELPCILTLIKQHKLSPDVIIIDGFVFLDGVRKAGLGFYVFEAFHKEIPVIGVAKQPFKDIPSQYALYRGLSSSPLYITSVGIDAQSARQNIANMEGSFRMPTLLKKADQLCRAWFF